MLSERAKRMLDNVSRDMDSILRNFVPGAKITVIVRPASGDVEGEVVLTNDNFDEAARAIERAKQLTEACLSACHPRSA